MISAAFAGAGGAMYAHYQLQVDEPSVGIAHRLKFEIFNAVKRIE